MPEYRLSICIPAYNRARFLDDLVESIVANMTPACEIVIAEDRSPERQEIKAIAERWIAKAPFAIRFLENAENLGYDGNLRNLIRQAKGEYCLFMGNDDVMGPGAIERVLNAISTYPDLGVVIRSYAIFFDTPAKPFETVRQFDSDRYFKAGADTAVTFFRRTGVISSLVFNRQAAIDAESTKWDGALYYQTYLASKILQTRAGYYISSVQHLSRADVPPDFGHSKSEKGFFKPGEYTNAARLKMISGLLNIAQDVEISGVKGFRKRVLQDFGNYSHYLFVFQARQSRSRLLGFYAGFCKLGFWRVPAVHAYLLSVFVLGANRSASLVAKLRDRLKSTPVLGSIYTGEKTG